MSTAFLCQESSREQKEQGQTPSQPKGDDPSGQLRPLETPCTVDPAIFLTDK